MLKSKSEEKIDTLLSKSQIPIIDLAHCGTEECPVKSVVTRVAGQLQKALSEKGLAFLVNHGISQEKLEVAWHHLDDFCQLPTDVKEHYIRKGDDNHGYIKPGLEKFDGNTPELRHAFNICTLSAKSLPEDPLPGFSDHVAGLAKEFKSLSSFLLQALAVSLELPQSFFVERHSHMLSGDHDNETTLRLLYYPPVIEDDNKCEMMKGKCKYSYQRCGMDSPNFQPEDDFKSLRITAEQNRNGENGKENGNDNPTTSNGMKNGIIRCGAHCDYGTFTLLAQDSEGGLEVKLPGMEKWQRVGHLPGAILINCGEILSLWTEERLPALSHRVVIPQQEHLRARGRHSIAFFCHPDNITMISPADLQNNAATLNCDTKKPRKKSFKNAKTKVYNAYQIIQRRFKETYGS